MRTHKIGETTIEYPDEISFCFNPVVINIYGHAWDYVEVTVTDIVSEISYKEKRALFNNACFFGCVVLHAVYFDTVEFGKIDYHRRFRNDSGVRTCVLCRY